MTYCCCLGIMTGTSLDGIDLAVLYISDGDNGSSRVESMGPSAMYTMPSDTKQLLVCSMQHAHQMMMTQIAECEDIGKSPATKLSLPLPPTPPSDNNNDNNDHKNTILHQAQLSYTNAVADAAEHFIIKNSNISIDLIGFHGQTILHAPHHGLSWQLGNSQLLAERLGIKVVGSFRQNDIANGGEGAPLVPLYHQALVRNITTASWSTDKVGVVVIINIGGISNVTAIDMQTNAIISAFDCGPGNALMDMFMQTMCNKEYDNNGELASRGSIDSHLLHEMLHHETVLQFLAKRPPKSLDKNTISIDSLIYSNLHEYENDKAHGERKCTLGKNPADIMATLNEFTVICCREGVKRHVPIQPIRCLVTGGGRKNNELMRRVRQAFHPAVTDVVESVGWRGDVLEAEAFAFLAYQSVNKKPLTMPQTTGVTGPMSGGDLYMP